MEKPRYLKCQLECLQSEYDHAKYQLQETVRRANNAESQIPKLQDEIDKKLLNTKEGKQIQKLQCTITCKDQEICSLTQKKAELEQQLSEAKQYAEEVCKWSERAEEDQQRLCTQEQELHQKEHVTTDLKCRLEHTQKHVQEMQQRIPVLEHENEVDCCKYCKQQSDGKHHTVNCEWEKITRKLERQLKKLSQVKKKCDGLEKRLKEKEKQVVSMEKLKMSSYKDEI